ncbi:hypothetical protein C0J52_06804 [Blattella germanica]|nr:hypothetical protein C0J52_06804 [Blattella germanica]
MPLSPQDVARAIALIDDGRRLRYAARTIGAPYTTVQEAVKRFRETQSYSRRPGSGRKRITSGRDDRSSARSTLNTIFAEVNIPFDCLFFVAQSDDNTVYLTEVYRITPSYPLQTYPFGLSPCLNNSRIFSKTC